MRIFYNQSVDAIARRLVPGIAVAALAAWGVASGGAVLEEIPELASPTAQAANVGSGSGSAVGAAADAGSWQDGTWTGTAQGYGGDVTVSVTIANKKITAIEVVSASAETPSFFSKAKAIIPKIIEAQNPDVDVVSGATYSSNGIINAVKNALTKASGGTVTETSNGGGAAANNTAAGSTSSDAFQDGSYKDGTYTGTAAGFRGNITVSVTIAGGKISTISVVSAPGNDEPYLSKAKTLIAKVIAKQSPNGVDTVSGATYSSNGILNAIKQALTKAAGGTVSETPSSSGGTTTGGDSSPSKLDKDTYTGSYKDGTYTGTGKGFKGTVTANVTISGGKITKIDVSGSDDAAYFGKAKNGIINKMISSQSTNVDTVSGATYSSNGIITAVRNALKKAQTTGGTTTDDDTDKTLTEKTYTDTATEFYGIGYGYRNGRIVLKVTASGGDLKSIDVIEKNDQDDDYFNDAMEIIEKVKNGKNINVVDTVSGATYSSKGILTALTEALNKAVIAGQYTPPKETPDTPEPTPTPTPEPEGSTYTETVTVNPDEDEDFDAYALLVDVTVQDGKVTSVALNASNTFGDNKSNKRYSDKAAKMELTGKTAADIDGVDTISGATCSSKAIKEAVKQALTKAEG